MISSWLEDFDMTLSGTSFDYQKIIEKVATDLNNIHCYGTNLIKSHHRIGQNGFARFPVWGKALDGKILDNNSLDGLVRYQQHRFNVDRGGEYETMVVSVHFKGS